MNDPRIELVAKLRAVKTCKDEPGQCGPDSGPMCGTHDFSFLYAPLLREAADTIEALLREPAAPSETITEQGWALRQKMKPELWLHPYHAEGGPEHAKLCVTRDDAMTKCPSWREAVYLTRAITVTLIPPPQTPEPERAFGQNIRDTIAEFKGEPYTADQETP